MTSLFHFVQVSHKTQQNDDASVEIVTELTLLEVKILFRLSRVLAHKGSCKSMSYWSWTGLWLFPVSVLTSVILLKNFNERSSYITFGYICRILLFHLHKHKLNHIHYTTAGLVCTRDHCRYILLQKISESHRYQLNCCLI